MQDRSDLSRRTVLRGATAVAATAALWSPAIAQAAARVVVIGGGFGGASCARALRQLDPKLRVTLIEPNRVFTACPFSNDVIAGDRSIDAQQFTYEKVAADDIAVVQQAAMKVDPQARTIGLADGSTL
ncbi:MAG: cytochrome, partial [Tardiphaga sp.]|nr:cytochrome [Tardiphaga sp.]